MGFDDGPSDCQSKTHSVLLGRVESVEDVVAMTLVNTYAGIRDNDQDRLKPVLLCSNAQLPWSSADER